MGQVWGQWRIPGRIQGDVPRVIHLTFSGFVLHLLRIYSCSCPTNSIGPLQMDKQLAAAADQLATVSHRDSAGKLLEDMEAERLRSQALAAALAEAEEMAGAAAAEATALRRQAEACGHRSGSSGGSRILPPDSETTSRRHVHPTQAA